MEKASESKQVSLYMTGLCSLQSNTRLTNMTRYSNYECTHTHTHTTYICIYTYICKKQRKNLMNKWLVPSSSGMINLLHNTRQWWRCLAFLNLLMKKWLVKSVHYKVSLPSAVSSFIRSHPVLLFQNCSKLSRRRPVVWFSHLRAFNKASPKAEFRLWSFWW